MLMGVVSVRAAACPCSVSQPWMLGMLHPAGTSGPEETPIRSGVLASLFGAMAQQCKSSHQAWILKHPETEPEYDVDDTFLLLKHSNGKLYHGGQGPGGAAWRVKERDCYEPYEP